jgi:hypothetical protein
MEFARCPERSCGALAEILDRWELDSTDGPLEHVKTRCLHGHTFTVLAESLPPESLPPESLPPESLRPEPLPEAPVSVAADTVPPWTNP